MKSLIYSTFIGKTTFESPQPFRRSPWFHWQDNILNDPNCCMPNQPPTFSKLLVPHLSTPTLKMHKQNFVE